MPLTPPLRRPARVVVLVSGTGTNLQALIDASRDPAYGVTVVAVGADRDGIEGLARAERAGIPTFVRRVKDFETRDDWDRALTEACQEHDPDLVVLAGFMKLTGKAFLDVFGGRCVNTHPALSPSFPGMHGPADALAYGVKVSGVTVHLVDEGVLTLRTRARTLLRDDLPLIDDDDPATGPIDVVVAPVRSLLQPQVKGLADLAPVAVSQRTWNTWDYAALWISMAHCVPTYTMASGLIKAGMSWGQALFTILLANIFPVPDAGRLLVASFVLLLSSMFVDGGPGTGAGTEGTEGSSRPSEPSHVVAVPQEVR